jgi:hypothetical protein
MLMRGEISELAIAAAFGTLWARFTMFNKARMKGTT